MAMCTAEATETRSLKDLKGDSLDFSSETWDGNAAKLVDGVWSFGEYHTPALVEGLPTINNRTFAFHIRDAEEGDFLLAIGPTGENTIRGLKALSRDLNLPVRFVLSQGANHHMYLEKWYEEFPHARILIPGRKIPITRNGKALQKKFPFRWEVYHGHLGIPALKKYSDQLDFAIFDQWYGIGDHDFTSTSCQCKVNIGPFEYAMKFAMAKRDQLMDAVWTYHKASGLCIYEHNVDIWLTKEQHSQIPFPVNFMLGVERFQSFLPESFSRIEDPRINYETWQKVLSWNILTLVDYHIHPGTSIRLEKADDARKKVRELIAKSGEDDPTGYNLWYNRQNRQIRKALLAIVAVAVVFLAYKYQDEN